jgi:hypothetical protein
MIYAVSYIYMAEHLNIYILFYVAYEKCIICYFTSLMIYKVSYIFTLREKVTLGLLKLLFLGSGCGRVV